MQKIEQILADRGAEYGDFTTQAGIAQELKGIISCGAADLTLVQAEALDMICHKIARIVNGNPNNRDSWIDIAGYATLAADRVEGDE